MQPQIESPIPSPRAPPRELSDKDQKIQLFAFAVSPVVYIPFSHWISTTRVGTMLSLFFGVMVYGSLLMAAVPVIFIHVAGLISEQTRRRSFFRLMLCLLFVASFVTGVLLGQKVRMVGMRAFAQRSRPLIAAIEPLGSVQTPLGVLNWDQILYFPNQNYPAKGYGGPIELIDDWAYVHE